MEKEIDDIVLKYMNKDYFPGVSCIAVKDNETVFDKCYGYLSTEPEKIKMQNDTIFDLASVTKIVTTTMILMLITEGKINLNSSLKNYIKNISEDEKLSKSIGGITIKQLMTHTSGLISWYPFYIRRKDGLYSILKSIDCKTGNNDVLYSDLNFILLGETVKAVTGLTLKDAVKHYIKEPLNLKTLGYGPVSDTNVAATEFGNQIEEEMCKDRGLRFDGWRPAGIPIKGEVNDGNAYYYFKGQSGHAGVFSSKYDLVKLAMLYINKGEADGKRLISPEVVDASMKEYYPARGLGWQFSSMYPNGFGHTGFTGPSIYLVPVDKVVVVTLTSRLHEKNPKSINEFRQELHSTIINFLGGFNNVKEKQ